MALDPSIILGGQSVNALGAMQAGNQLAGQTIDINRQNALAQLYQTQGAGIANGDPSALNALAGMDPQAAMGFKSAQQDMQFSAERMQMIRDQTKVAAAEQAAKMSAEQRAASVAQIENGLKGASFFYQKGDRAGYEGFLRQNQLDPAQYPFDMFPATAAQYEGVLEAFKTFQPAVPEWRPATPEESKANGAVAGQINTKTGKFDAQNPPTGMRVESDGKGGFTMTQGAGVTDPKEAAKTAVRTEQAQVAADVVLGKIGEARAFVVNEDGYLPTTGYIGQKLMETGGTAANDLRSTLATIKANVAFDKLQQMRASSPTGGALGAVSDKEMELLSSALTSLDQTQSAEQLAKNLDNLEKLYKTIADKLNAPPSAAGQAPAGFEDIWNKY